MANKNGNVYGLTMLSPIKVNKMLKPSHEQRIRDVLTALPTSGPESPMSRVPQTHMCRWFVLDDFRYEGVPTKQEHLQSPYLVFTCNFDGDLDSFLETMHANVPELIRDLYGNCYGDFDTDSVMEWKAYVRKCQVKTTFLYADYNNWTVKDVKNALSVQLRFLKFLEQNQGKPAAEKKAAFQTFMAENRHLIPDSAGVQVI